MVMRAERLLYLAYYLKKQNWGQFSKAIRFASSESRRSGPALALGAAYSSLRYNISPMEYFQFGFYKKSKAEKFAWAGTGYMYEYQLKMNPISARKVLDDKRKFYRAYGHLMFHKVADREDLARIEGLAEALIQNTSGKLVFKVADGKCGLHVLIKQSEGFDTKGLLTFMEQRKFDLVEEFIAQDRELNRLSPSAVNTVRIITQLNSDQEVELLGCRLRISIGSPVDNMAAGNIAAPIDERTGVVIGPGVFSDISKPPVLTHPLTGVEIVGFQIPYWAEVLSLVREAALVHTENRSVGWDIAIGEHGPGLIEGNHDWCKLVWQLPVNKGLKDVLASHLGV